jgi:hypothetical protein
MGPAKIFGHLNKIVGTSVGVLRSLAALKGIPQSTGMLLQASASTPELIQDF